MMPSIKETKNAIEALRGITASRSEGEWRVAFKLNRLHEMYPGNNRPWYEEKQEASAYYTNDAEDAIATAKRMLDESVAEKVATSKTLIFDESSSVDCHAMADYCFRIRGEHNAEVEENTNYLKIEISSDEVIQFKDRITKKFGSFPFSEKENNNAVEGVKNMSSVNISIYETGNAAFVDLGKQHEVVRILKEASEKIRESESYDSLILRDLNGNTVGAINGGGNKSTDVSAEFSDPDDAHEVARLIDVVAEHIQNGNTEFILRDVNGNKVGDGNTIEWSADKTLMNIGWEGEAGIDFKDALKSGKVYLADGIEDGAFRYVVPTNDFEPGYHQGQGDAWLVNARGVVSPDYEDTQIVRETDFKDLPRDHRDDLVALHEGSMTFEGFEKIYGDDDQDLEP